VRMKVCRCVCVCMYACVCMYVSMYVCGCVFMYVFIYLLNMLHHPEVTLHTIM